MKQKKTHYAKKFIVLHWLIALIVMTMLAGSFFLEDLPQAIKPTGIMMHKSLGITILILMILRVFWLAKLKRPTLPAAMPRWELWLARGVQAAMYVTLIGMAMVGWVMSALSNRIPVFFGIVRLPLPGISPNPDLAEIFFQIHQTIAWILIALIVLHIVGALKHAIIDKDNVMETMLP